MRVAIAGAGAVGLSIARELIRNNHEVTLIERLLEHVDRAAIPEANWVLADACELALLEAARLETYDTVIAATGLGYAIGKWLGSVLTGLLIGLSLGFALGMLKLIRAVRRANRS